MARHTSNNQPQSPNLTSINSGTSCQRRVSEKDSVPNSDIIDFGELDTDKCRSPVYPNAHASSSRVQLEVVKSPEDHTDDFLEGEMDEMTFNPNPDFPDDVSDASDLHSRASASDSCTLTDSGSFDSASDKPWSVDEPEKPRISCLLCKKPPDVLCATICGHLFCFDCICLEFEISGICPVCGKSGTRKQLRKIYLGI